MKQTALSAFSLSFVRTTLCVRCASFVSLSSHTSYRLHFKHRVDRARAIESPSRELLLVCNLVAHPSSWGANSKVHGQSMCDARWVPLALRGTLGQVCLSRPMPEREG